MTDLLELQRLAENIAREAGDVLLARLHDVRTDVGTKSSLTDMVSEVDRESEALIVSRILAARADDGILGEEGSDRAGTSGVRWVIDPLDGTTNYLYRRGDFCVSIGIEVDGALAVGVVFDPSRDELFSAARGHGATLRGTAIAVSKVTTLGQALTGTGFGYDKDVRRAQGQVAARVVPIVRDLRRAGSAALDLCAVACGRLDAYYESGLNAWDMAAGRVIIEEAGGRTEFVDVPGERPTLVAANPVLWRQLAARLQAT